MNLKQLPNSQIIEIIDEWIHSERDRKIMKRRFIDGIGFEMLAEEFCLSVIHTKTIVYKGEKELINHIE